MSRIRRITPSNTSESARAMDRAMKKAGVAPADRQQFMDWTIDSMYQNFKENRVNQRVMTENAVRNLGLRLPNGTVKQEYRAQFSLPADLVTDVELDGAAGLGLDFTMSPAGVCTVGGVPNAVGDFNLTLRYKTVAGEPESQLRLPIAFNPNPRDMWKDLPTDPNVPYYKPDSDKAFVKVSDTEGGPKKDIVAASQRGRSHARDAKARDDHFSLFHCDESDWYIIAVADGAGSAKYSRKGSEVACKTVTDHCKAMLLDNPAFEEAIRNYNASPDDARKRFELTNWVHEIVLKGAKKAHDRINEVARSEEGLRLKDFATTLMFAICKKYDFGWFIASFWVGDGAMCLFDAEAKTAKLLGTPDEGEYSGQTRFLTMPEIFRGPEVYNRLRMSVVPDFTALFLMSDGVSDPMFETDRNLNDSAKWAEFWETLKKGFPEDGIGGVDLTDDNEAAKDQLLGWLDFWSPGNHDDRTIAILY